MGKESRTECSVFQAVWPLRHVRPLRSLHCDEPWTRKALNPTFDLRVCAVHVMEISSQEFRVHPFESDPVIVEPKYKGRQRQDVVARMRQMGNVPLPELEAQARSTNNSKRARTDAVALLPSMTELQLPLVSYGPANPTPEQERLVLEERLRAALASRDCVLGLVNMLRRELLARFHLSYEWLLHVDERRCRSWTGLPRLGLRCLVQLLGDCGLHESMFHDYRRRG